MAPPVAAKAPTVAEPVGLLSSDGGAVPLKGVLVKARVIDMVSEICIFQVSEGESV